jgi:hypothetical protein
VNERGSGRWFRAGLCRSSSFGLCLLSELLLLRETAPESLTEVATNVHDFCDPIRSPDERTAVVFFSLADGQVTRPSGPSRRSILLLHGEVKRPMLSTAVDMNSFVFEALLLQRVHHHCFRSWVAEILVNSILSKSSLERYHNHHHNGSTGGLRSDREV